MHAINNHRVKGTSILPSEANICGNFSRKWNTLVRTFCHWNWPSLGVEYLTDIEAMLYYMKYRTHAFWHNSCTGNTCTSLSRTNDPCSRELNGHKCLFGTLNVEIGLHGFFRSVLLLPLSVCCCCGFYASSHCSLTKHTNLIVSAFVCVCVFWIECSQCEPNFTI